MNPLFERFPTVPELFEAEQDQVAEALFDWIRSVHHRTYLAEMNFLNAAEDFYKSEEALAIVSGAWRSLEASQLLVKAPRDQNPNGRVLHPRALKPDATWTGLNAEHMTAVALLHPTIRSKCVPAIRRGNFPGAVIDGFVTLEDEMRKIIGAGPELHGRKLVNAYFRKLKVTNPNVRHLEEERRRFIDAFVLYRGDAGHTALTVTQPAQALERLIEVSSMMRFVDEHS